MHNFCKQFVRNEGQFGTVGVMNEIFETCWHLPFKNLMQTQGSFKSSAFYIKKGTLDIATIPNPA